MQNTIRLQYEVLADDRKAYKDYLCLNIVLLSQLLIKGELLHSVNY